MRVNRCGRVPWSCWIGSLHGRWRQRRSAACAACQPIGTIARGGGVAVGAGRPGAARSAQSR